MNGMDAMNPLSAPHHYYWDAVTSPLPREGKAAEVIKKIVLVVIGIFLIPLFGIMKLIGDKLPINKAVVFFDTSSPFTVSNQNGYVDASYHAHNGKMIVDY